MKTSRSSSYVLNNGLLARSRANSRSDQISSLGLTMKTGPRSVSPIRTSPGSIPSRVSAGNAQLLRTAFARSDGASDPTSTVPMPNSRTRASSATATLSILIFANVAFGSVAASLPQTKRLTASGHKRSGGCLPQNRPFASLVDYALYIQA